MSEVINTELALAAGAFEPGAVVYLYQLDLAPIGISAVYTFTKNGTCSFGGIRYAQAYVEVDGFEWNGRGVLPQPTLRLSNATRLIAGSLKTTQDLIGAQLTRLKTFDQFLDGSPMADGTAMFAPDVYLIEQKTAHDKYMIEFKLSAKMDQQGRKLPGRLILRNMCTLRYRVWDPKPQAYNYDHVTCPYTGTGAYDQNDQATTPDKDMCSKRFTNGCKNRFGPTAVLAADKTNDYPFGGFPGVSRQHF